MLDTYHSFLDPQMREIITGTEVRCPEEGTQMECRLNVLNRGVFNFLFTNGCAPESDLIDTSNDISLKPDYKNMSILYHVEQTFEAVASCNLPQGDRSNEILGKSYYIDYNGRKIFTSPRLDEVLKGAEPIVERESEFDRFSNNKLPPKWASDFGGDLGQLFNSPGDWSGQYDSAPFLGLVQSTYVFGVRIRIPFSFIISYYCGPCNKYGNKTISSKKIENRDSVRFSRSGISLDPKRKPEAIKRDKSTAKDVCDKFGGGVDDRSPNTGNTGISPEHAFSLSNLLGRIGEEFTKDKFLISDNVSKLKEDLRNIIKEMNIDNLKSYNAYSCKDYLCELNLNLDCQFDSDEINNSIIDDDRVLE